LLACCLVAAAPDTLRRTALYARYAEAGVTVTNAANHEKDLAWFRRHAEGFDVTVDDAAERYAMLAVQGPRARDIHILRRVCGSWRP
jgi:glycine cleavage system aminomethyltransferase T